MGSVIPAAGVGFLTGKIELLLATTRRLGFQAGIAARSKVGASVSILLSVGSRVISHYTRLHNYGGVRPLPRYPQADVLMNCGHLSLCCAAIAATVYDPVELGFQLGVRRKQINGVTELYTPSST